MKRLLLSTSTAMALSGVCFAPADGAGAGVAEASAEATKTRNVFSQDQIDEIRSLRAEVHPEGHDKAGKPVWSHAKLADKFGTNAGTISMIVRNRTYKDPDYKPTNDNN